MHFLVIMLGLSLIIVAVNRDYLGFSQRAKVHASRVLVAFLIIVLIVAIFQYTQTPAKPHYFTVPTH